MRHATQSGVAAYGPCLSIALHPQSPLRFRVAGDPAPFDRKAAIALMVQENFRDWHWLGEVNGPKCANKQIRLLRRYVAGLGVHTPDKWQRHLFGRARKGVRPWEYPLGIPDFSDSVIVRRKYIQPDNRPLSVFPGKKTAQSNWKISTAAARNRRKMVGGRQQESRGRPRKAA